MFTILNLEDGGLWVTGTDAAGNSGSCVLYSDVINAADLAQQQFELTGKFDDKVTEMFAPLLEIAAELDELVAPKGAFDVITVGEDVEGQEAVKFHLDPIGKLIHRLRTSNADEVRWISPTQLGVLKV